MEKWLLVVANEDSNIETIQKEWLKSGVFLTLIPTIEDALNKLTYEDYLAIIIFNDDSFALRISDIRQIKPRIPVICMPSKFDYNSDDVIKRMRLADDMANSNALQEYVNQTPLSQLNASYDDILVYNDLILSPKYHKSHFMERDIKLSKNQFNALEVLMRHRGMPLTYDQVYDHVFGEYYGSESAYSAIRHIVAEIRKKMNAVGSFDYIENVRGIGYRFGRYE